MRISQKMEPGGIEPLPNPHSDTEEAGFEAERATLRAMASDPTLADLIRAWPHLSAEVRQAVRSLALAAAAAPEPSSTQQTSPRTLSGVSFGFNTISRQGAGASSSPGTQAPPDAASTAGAAEAGGAS